MFRALSVKKELSFAIRYHKRLVLGEGKNKSIIDMRMFPEIL